MASGTASGLAGYRVYKSATGKPGSFEPLEETRETRYQDHGFQFDQTYYYKVRAVFREGHQAAESEDSALVQFTPRDTFPPAAPSGVTAIYTNGAVELIWAPNGEPDLAGYNVYRRTESGPPQRINSTLLGAPAFRDVSTDPARAYYYWVSAVDQSHNESSASPSVRVETR
jgi:fibronectin type 3 domain-containing protein